LDKRRLAGIVILLSDWKKETSPTKGGRMVILGLSSGRQVAVSVKHFRLRAAVLALVPGDTGVVPAIVKLVF
jgi:hypothetical protein